MTTHVLVLCTHNSARSVLAEAMFNHWAMRSGVNARAHSAGAAPSGRIHPQALATLEAAGVSTQGLASKHMDVFAQPDAPALRVVITVCDSAASQPCPIWPGAPARAHWSYPDPSAASLEAQAERFELTRQAIGYRMRPLAELPFDELNDQQLQTMLTQIGGS